MTQTPTLALNCWTNSDPIQVSELSGNFQKLDQAQTVVKLLDITDTVGGTNQIDINLSGVRLRDYRYLEFDVKCIGSTMTNQAKFRLNNAAYGYYRCTYAQNSDMTRYTELSSIYTYNGNAPDGGEMRESFARVQLFCSGSTIFADTSGFSFQNTQIIGSRHSSVIRSAGVTPEKLSSLNLYVTEGTFVAGTKITGYGVRK